MPHLTKQDHEDKRDRTRRYREEHALRDDELDVIAYAKSKCCRTDVALLKEKRERRCRSCATTWAPDLDETMMGGSRMRRAA